MKRHGITAEIMQTFTVAQSNGSALLLIPPYNTT